MKEDLKKEKRGEKKKKRKGVIKHRLKYLNEDRNKKIHKNRKNFRGGGEEFSGWPEYIPLNTIFANDKEISLQTDNYLS